jgi:hypothetical protein
MNNDRKNLFEEEKEDPRSVPVSAGTGRYGYGWVPLKPGTYSTVAYLIIILTVQKYCSLERLQGDYLLIVPRIENDEDDNGNSCLEMRQDFGESEFSSSRNLGVT